LELFDYVSLDSYCFLEILDELRNVLIRAL